MGQWYGMRLQTSRLSLLILHELLIAISTAEQNGVFSNDHYLEAVRRLGRKSRKDWKELVALARATESTDPVRNYIMRVRHNFSAHYYQPKALLEGYRHFFFQEPANEFNKHALASFGGEVETTRFYFADAAAQMGQKLLDPDNVRVEQVYEHTLRMFQALRFLVEEYLNLKSDTVAQREDGH